MANLKATSDVFQVKKTSTSRTQDNLSTHLYYPFPREQLHQKIRGLPNDSRKHQCRDN